MFCGLFECVGERDGEEEEKQGPKSRKEHEKESMSERSTGPGVVKKEEEEKKKAFDDFDGEDAKTLTTTRKRDEK